MAQHVPAAPRLSVARCWTDDPRPDLPDSWLWGPLLTAAYRGDGRARDGLFGALHGLRCCGVGLQEVDGRFRLTRGELSEAEYAAARAVYLVPHADRLRHLLNPEGSG